MDYTHHNAFLQFFYRNPGATSESNHAFPSISTLTSNQFYPLRFRINRLVINWVIMEL